MGTFFFHNLKKKVVANGLLQEKPATVENSAPSSPEAVSKGVPPQPKPKDVPAAPPVNPVKKTKEVRLATEIPAQNTTESGSNSVPVAEKPAAEEITRLEKEAGELSRRLHNAIAENKKLREEIERLNASIDARGLDQFIAAADSGDQVFLKGVGEVQLATAFGKTVVRVPTRAASRADGMFSSVMAERVPLRGFIYYICDTRMLQFNRS